MSRATRTYLRFSLARRMEHLAMLLVFATLGLTGLPQRFSGSWLSTAITGWLGGIEALRTIHHIAAAVMMLGTAWHLLSGGYHVFVLRTRMSMLPTLADVRDGFAALRYNLGLARAYPQMGRYTFEEKLEYWAFVWGAVIMGLTGFLMWNPVFVTRFLPGQYIPAARAAHGAEAVLAVLAIIIWHMYGVHIKRFNRSMWTGRQSETEMLHEHPLELADLKAGIADRRPDPATVRRRQAVYYPVSAALSVVFLGAIYGFVNAEQTALQTVPPQEVVEVFVVQTPTPSPTALPAPTARPVSPPLAGAPAPTWDGAIAILLQSRCAACHGPAAVAGLDLTSWASAMEGGTSGRAILEGNASNSLLVLKQQAGEHLGQLSQDELDVLISWIEAGAPER